MLYQRVTSLRRGEAGDGVSIRCISLQNPAILLPLYLGLLGFETWLLLVNPILAMTLLILTTMFGGIPVAFSLGVTGCIMLMVLLGGEGGLLQAPMVAYKSLESFVLAAIPLFVLGAAILSKGKLGEQLYDVATKFVGHLPGGLAVATAVAGAIFGAVCGSSVASAATFGLIAIPIMINRGYNKRLIYGTVAISGTLASMIPPSLGMILYGSVTDVSIGKLFMAGVIPGIMETIIISLLILYMCRGGRNHTPIPKATWKERLVSLKNGIFALLAPVVILGGIYLGVFTPTEAAAVAVLYALLVTIFALRTIRWKEMKEIITDSVKTTIMLMFIIVGALILGHLFTYLHIPEKFMLAVRGFNPWMVMILINVLIIFLGCFLEGASIILITVPVVYPVLVALGFDPIWFGIVLTANLEIAMLTPPVGMNLFVIQGITQDKISEVIQGAWPFIMLQTVNLAILMAFPILSTWLPGTMKW